MCERKKKSSLTLWNYGDMYMVRIWFEIAFSRAISQPSKPLSSHIQPMNTSHLSSSGVIASFLSRLMGLTFSTILNVQIILDFAACDFFFPLFPFAPQKRKCAATHQSSSHFHRCQVIHHILNVWISNIALQQPKWCNRYGLWAHIKWIPPGYSLWMQRDIWSDY